MRSSSQWLRERREHATYRKAHKRLSRLDNMTILGWCDQVGTTLARALDDYRRQSDPLILDEAASSVLCLGAALEILKIRS
jgi:hypothetical protein